MYMILIFRIIFWLGIIFTIVSLFVPLNLFYWLIGIGVAFICFSLYEQHVLKPHKKEEREQKEPVKRVLPQKVVTKTLHLPKVKEQTKDEIKQKETFFTKIKHLFNKKEKMHQPAIKHDFVYHTPQFENIKTLFKERLQPVKATKPEQNMSMKAKITKHQLPSPLKSTQLFDWEREEHYKPTGAEHVPAEHDDRYHIANIEDERYTEKPQTLATPQLSSIKQIIAPKKEEGEHKKQEIAPQPKEGLQRIVKSKEDQPINQQDLATLQEYIQNALKAKHPIEHIKAAVLQAGWPKNLVIEAFKQKNQADKNKKFLILGGMIALLIITLIILNVMDLLLLSYIGEFISSASLEFYIGGTILLLIVIGIILFKTKKMLKAKKIRTTQETVEHVKEIKEKLQAGRKNFETDFDRLYKLLKEKKRLTLAEVAQGFGVTKAKAEEWGKILKEQGLIGVYYPAMGEAELRWKK